MYHSSLPSPLRLTHTKHAATQCNYTSQLLSLEARLVKGAARPMPVALQQIITSLKHSKYAELLAGHPDAAFRDYILLGIQQGFRIGFDGKTERPGRTWNGGTASWRCGMAQAMMFATPKSDPDITPSDASGNWGCGAYTGWPHSRTPHHNKGTSPHCSGSGDMGAQMEGKDDSSKVRQCCGSCNHQLWDVKDPPKP